MAFRECGLLVRFPDEVEYVEATAGIEVAAVVDAVALNAEVVGGVFGDEAGK